MDARYFVAVITSVLLVSSGVSLAGIPDPSQSGCDFPGSLPCPDPVPVVVTVRDAFHIPVVDCSTDVTIDVHSGTLDGGQETVVIGVTAGLRVSRPACATPG